MVTMTPNNGMQRTPLRVATDASVRRFLRPAVLPHPVASLLPEERFLRSLILHGEVGRFEAFPIGSAALHRGVVALGDGHEELQMHIQPELEGGLGGVHDGRGQRLHGGPRRGHAGRGQGRRRARRGGDGVREAGGGAGVRRVGMGLASEGVAG